MKLSQKTMKWYYTKFFALHLLIHAVVGNYLPFVAAEAGGPRLIFFAGLLVILNGIMVVQWGREAALRFLISPEVETVTLTEVVLAGGRASGTNIQCEEYPGQDFFNLGVYLTDEWQVGQQVPVAFYKLGGLPRLADLVVG